MVKNKIAVIGATGNVGRKIIEIYHTRKSGDPQALRLFASARSKGKLLQFDHHIYSVEDIASYDFNDCYLALFATDSDISRLYIPKALEKKCVVIDSSSLYRLSPDVPLIVPPVNAHLIDSTHLLYATANCIASPLSIVLKPLHNQWEVSRVIASTYQSTSGAGKEPMDELFDTSKSFLKDEKPLTKLFPRPIAFNVIPQVDKILENGFSNEESKIMKEVQKIISPEIKISATSVRVPVAIGHSMAVSIEFKKAITLDQVYQALALSPGVLISTDHYSTPLEIAGQNEVFVGRLRRDPTVENGVLLWIVSDNLRRGAALDVVEILEKIQQIYPAFV